MGGARGRAYAINGGICYPNQTTFVVVLATETNALLLVVDGDDDDEDGVLVMMAWLDVGRGVVSWRQCGDIGTLLARGGGDRIDRVMRNVFERGRKSFPVAEGGVGAVVFKNEVENQLEKTIKALRSYRGGEYISQKFKDYLKACGIVQQLTPPYTPQNNGLSERRNRTLLDMVQSMMNLTTLPLSFLDYALETSTQILNMVPTKKVDKTPYELWYGKVTNLSYLKFWGCEVLVKRDTPDKLRQRSVKCIFIGYPKETMGYYLYFLPENKIVVARYAEFLEKNLISQEVSGRAGKLEEIQDEDTSPSENTSKIPMEVEGFEPPQEEVVPVRRSARTHRAPGEAAFILGIKIYQDILKQLIGISQSAYMDKILKRFTMDNSKRGYIPMKKKILDLNKTQRASTAEEVKREPHWTAMKTILQYLRNIKDMILVYGGNPEAELRVDCHCNAGFETNRDDIKSQTGHVSVLNKGAVD
ncbi:retrotransposon protein, putative, ty1-copia subclass [Tanacetum coccineum]